MSEIRPLSDEDFESFVNIFANAYPAMLPENFGLEEKNNLVERWTKDQAEPDTNIFYGCFRNGLLLGGMKIYDFVMNLHGINTKVCGVGQICVDLIHKKEHIAKDLVEYYLKHCFDIRACIAVLYPFRPDFYYQMGWGYGTKMNQYHFRPVDLPRGSNEGVGYLTIADTQNVTSCFNRYAKCSHGMILKKQGYFERILERGKVIGFKKNDKVKGFLSFNFKKLYRDHFLLHDLIIRDFIYETPEALRAILTFLHVQLDQVNRIVLNTQDPNFHWLIHDPRNGKPNIFETNQECNLQGLGVMYRVIDTKLLFEALSQHNFNDITLKIKINIIDSFYPRNNGSFTVHFHSGYANLENNGESEVEISMNISEFSSMIMGVVNFKTLYQYGLATIDNNQYIESLNRLFKSDQPITVEQF